jgi:hypothetical protein
VAVAAAAAAAAAAAEEAEGGILPSEARGSSNIYGRCQELAEAVHMRWFVTGED